MKQYATVAGLMFPFLISIGNSHAQNRSDNGQLYANLQLTNQRYAFSYPASNSTVLALNPGYLAVGYTFTPKIAVQIGTVLGKSEHEFESSGTTTAGVPISSVTWDKTKSVALPLLARYTVGHPEGKRFNLDVFLGPVFIRSKQETRKTETLDGITEEKYNTSQSAWNTALSGGLGGRYAIGKYLQIIGDVSLNKNSQVAQKLSVTGNSAGITTSIALGLQYRFRTNN